MENDEDNDVIPQHPEILQAIPVEDWPLLRDVFKGDWPFAIYPYYIVQNWINWNKKEPHWEGVGIYCPYGDWSSGTMIVEHKAEYGYTLYVFTLEKGCKLLKEALTTTSVIDWSLGPLIYAIHQDQWDAVKASLVHLKLGTEFQIESGYHWIAKEEAVHFEVTCPPEVYIAPLSKEDLPTIDRLWPHSYRGSDDFLKQLLHQNGGLGLYLKADRSLVSWIMKNQHLGLGILQTVDSHKRKGYARILSMAMTKKMAEEGVDVHTCIVRQNVVSQTLFKSLGFKHVDHLMFEKVKEFNKDQQHAR